MKFDSFHPGINLFYFVVVFICAALFNHPAYIISMFFLGVVYSILQNGKKMIIADIILCFFALGYALYYSYYNHFGVTVLGTNIIGNSMTFEALFFGFFRGVKIAGFVMLLSCFFSVFKTDKLVFLLGRISPKAALFLAVLFRSIPRIIKRAKIMRDGFKCQNIKKGFFSLLSFISGLITWTLEDYMGSAVSMHSRGYLIKGRTSFSIYRFDNRDRTLVVIMGLGAAIIRMSCSLRSPFIQYNPTIEIKAMTGLDLFFIISYNLFLFIPVIIYLVYEIKFLYLLRRVHE